MFPNLKSYLSVLAIFTIHYLHKFGLLLSKQFIFAYFHALSSIKAGNKSYLYPLNCVIHLLQLKGLHFLFLYTSKAHLSETDNLLHYNFTALESYPSSLNLYSACICFTAWKAFKLFYLGNHGLTIKLIRSVMIEENYSCLLKAKSDFGRIDALLSRVFGYSPNANTMAANMQLLTLLIVNCFYWIHLITVAVSVSIFLGHLQLYSGAFTLTTISGVLTFVLFLFNAAVLCFVNSCLWYILFLVSTLAILVVSGTFLKLNQIEAFINGYLCKGFFPESKFGRFLTENELSLRFLADFNRIYGNVFFAFILIVTPFHAIFLMTLLLTREELTTEGRFFLGILLLMQMIFMASIAFFSIRVSLKLDRPAKKFLPLPAKSLTYRWRLLSRFKLSLYLEQFHTLNPYTVNYGKFGGKITYQSSGRLLFYYIKFIMFAFKLVRK